ncbi:hypothetical protein ACFPRL_19115 [Pseudoclavibacter helvolus]
MEFTIARIEAARPRVAWCVGWSRWASDMPAKLAGGCSRRPVAREIPLVVVKARSLATSRGDSRREAAWRPRVFSRGSRSLRLRRARPARRGSRRR